MEKEKVLIFGAGFYGKLAFEQNIDKDVSAFIDNDEKKQGQIFCGRPIIAPKEISNYEYSNIIIASLYGQSMGKQLNSMGIYKYSFFLGEVHGFYESQDLIVNPYIVNEEAHSEKQWSESEKMIYSRKEVYDLTEELYNNTPMFNHIEVETINQCNGSCSFCPVNKNIDPRIKTIMSEEMFKNIVDQLAELKYAGRFTTFSNNEPLLDDRIIEFNKYAREKLPNSRIHLFTNGTLLSIDKFVEIIDVLDELVIDNYRQDLKLIKPCKEIKEYCEKHEELKKKVTIVLRKPQEILTSRGGDAPNRSELERYDKDRCVLPFKQMIIRPDGKISLCCNDALGKYTLGDVSKEKLIDIWYGSKFKMVRKCLYEGRENWGNCKFCDTFSMG